MFGLGPTELIIILAIIIILFGVGRLSKIGGELGSATRSFREGLKEDKTGDENTEEPEESEDE